MPAKNFLQDSVLLLGRVSISLLFIIAGFEKIINFSDAAAFITSQGLPYSSILAFVAIILELGGGIMVLVGWKARIGGIMLFILAIPACWVLHSLWSVAPATVPNFFQNTLNEIALIGGLLYIIGCGAGSFSFDGRHQHF